MQLLHPLPFEYEELSEEEVIVKEENGAEGRMFVGVARLERDELSVALDYLFGSGKGRSEFVYLSHDARPPALSEASFPPEGERRASEALRRVGNFCELGMLGGKLPAGDALIMSACTGDIDILYVIRSGS